MYKVFRVMLWREWRESEVMGQGRCLMKRVSQVVRYWSGSREMMSGSGDGVDHVLGDRSR